MGVSSAEEAIGLLGGEGADGIEGIGIPLCDFLSSGICDIIGF
jgi:hypothetical protein